MFLSIIHLPFYTTDEEVIHASLLSCFGITREHGKILYKKEVSIVREKLSITLLVQSQEMPFTSKGGTVLESIEINPSFEEGQFYKLHATLRPTKKYDEKLHTIVKQDDRIKWVEEQIKKHGAKPLMISEKAKKKITFKESAEILAYDYEGVIKIANSEEFYKAYVDGIRQGKAYGCGMLQLQIA